MLQMTNISGSSIYAIGRETALVKTGNDCFDPYVSSVLMRLTYRSKVLFSVKISCYSLFV